MAQTQDEDMYLFDAGFSPNSGPFSTQTFGDLLPATPANRDASISMPAFLNPNDLAVKREPSEGGGVTAKLQHRKAASPSGSDSSSQESLSTSTQQHSRNVSQNFIATPSSHGAQNGNWGSGVNGLPILSGDELFADTAMTGIDPDVEASNQQMASDFDFETAASTPSGFGMTELNHYRTTPSALSFRGAQAFNMAGQSRGTSSRAPAAQAPFYLGESRESSPLNAMLPTQAQSPWSKPSPSSGLEETFNGITMNGDSPGNATFSPNLTFSNNPFTFDPDSSATPSSFAKDISSPPSTVHSADGAPQLFVYPTSLKSRVETQIPIKMTLSPLPTGIKKLRLPTHTVSKPKFLAKTESDRSPETLDLYTSLVCTSAMQDSVKLERAFARARGEDVGTLTRPSPSSSAGSQSSKDDEEKPLDGGEVRICPGCIQRERKRASRKKQKKPNEEELFQKDEEKRVIVFNTNEIKEWAEPVKDGPIPGTPETAQPLAPGAMQVELPMRIACYCRHQNEKLGFQVIFTIKDHTEKVIAQAMTNSIMITDDHKTHNAPPPVPTPSATFPNPSQVPGAGVFQTTFEFPGGSTSNTKMFKQSFSTTDLNGLKHNFNPNLPMTPMSTPFAVPSAILSNTSSTLTPKNLSRPASPTGIAGPTTKRRKQSGSGKVPSNLTMTRLETSNSQSGLPSLTTSAATSPFIPNMPPITATSDRGFAMPGFRQAQFDTSPPTPTSNEIAFINGINRSFSLENLPRQAIISAPNSRQASRPGSPSSTRNSFGAADPNHSQAVTNQLFGQPSRRPPPLIHKLVPAEGSVTGGAEVTLLGNGFYHGLEVMFGDTEATTTTFWGEKCLNCIAPPALQPGTVAVMFKHEHHQYNSLQPQSQTRHPIFTYTDDREVEIYRLALKTLGKQMRNPTDDPYSAAQQLLGGPSPSYWSTQGLYGVGGTGHHRQVNMTGSVAMDLIDLEANLLALLDCLDVISESKRPDLDLRRPTGQTQLHLASSLGLTRLAAALLSKGATVNVLDNNGNTPMHHAALNGHTHIIHRLRIAGADHRIRSIRNFTPADLAISLLAHQATVIPKPHYRSRSTGGTPMLLQSRNTSSTSLRAFWETSSTQYAYSDDSDDADAEDLSPADVSLDQPVPNLLRPNSQYDAARPLALTPGSRDSRVLLKLSQQSPNTINAPNDDAGLVSPAAFMVWRDQLAAQIHQFQESAHSMLPQLPHLPNLPALPTLPGLPDYQTYPMMRRVSSLFPQRPTSRPTTAPSSKEGWWETLTGSSSPSAPPAYKDLYPDETAERFELKKSSAMLAAADAAVDEHFEALSTASASSSRTLAKSQSSKAPSVDSGTRLLFSDQPINRLELRRDRKLFFFWIPLLAFLFALTMRNMLPEIWSGLSRIYEVMGKSQTPRREEVS